MSRALPKIFLATKFERSLHLDIMGEPIKKINIMKGHEPDLSAATYQIYDETHTMGNALRWMLMKNPKVEFCGYSAPHPSENIIQVRIQMYGMYRTLPDSIFRAIVDRTGFISIDKLSSLTALTEALAALDSLCESVEGAYKESLASGNYERWDERS
ncbi:hypothetical protein C0989_006335 [Termitomyces sp. Mn162]|nr:hypothetical protein C0989_006335 [Termitomyces sp. Mn162]